MPARLDPASASAADRYAAGVISHQVPTERHRLQLLEHMLDQETISTLEQREIHRSWRCLELGAGAGSIARWLASRCPDGQIVATDIGTTFLAELSAPNLQVRRHDVVTEDFPLGSFDLIHARWLLGNPKPVRVFATGVVALHEGLREFGDVDNGVATCEFADGQMACFFASRTMAHGHETSTEIFGTHGRLTVGQNPRKNRVDIADVIGMLRRLVGL